MISSIASISSSSSATVRVEKATSEFLMGPDWTMNIDICDTINTNQTLAKDVVKAVKKRLQHKNPKVQLLALTLLETMVKNCGDYVHFQIAERNILQHMVKIVKKRTDMHVRDKVLELIVSWYVAFGGSQGRYPQYFMAYEDLRRSGIEFPKRSADAAAIFTPPVTHPISKHPQPGYGMASSSSTRLDAAMAADDNFSLSNISSMRDVLDLLTDMLQAVDPSDRLAVKDEVVVDLIEQCCANQKKLMEVLATSGVEELLFQGLELNDDLQSVLARHDAIASGSPLPLPQVTNPEAGGSEKHDSSPEPADISIHKATASDAKPADVSVHNAATSNAKPSAAVVPAHGSIDEEDEEEEDDFALLARRHSKPYHHNGTTSSATPSSPDTSNALVPVTPAHVQTKEQDIMDDLLSITLSTSASTEQTTTMPLGVTFSSEAYPGKPGLAYNHYVASWAQAQPQAQSQAQAQFQSHPPYSHPRQQFTSQPQPQFQHQPLGHSESPHVTQPAQQHYSSEYPPPPWATTPGYFTNQNPVSKAPQTYSMPPRPLHNDLLSVNGQTQVNYSVSSTAAANAGQKPFIPSYRLFEDLDVFGNGDGRFKATSKGPQSLSGSANHSMVGGRK